MSTWHQRHDMRRSSRYTSTWTWLAKTPRDTAPGAERFGAMPLNWLQAVGGERDENKSPLTKGGYRGVFQRCDSNGCGLNAPPLPPLRKGGNRSDPTPHLRFRADSPILRFGRSATLPAMTVPGVGADHAPSNGTFEHENPARLTQFRPNKERNFLLSRKGLPEQSW
jgi:hypothetical protein